MNRCLVLLLSSFYLASNIRGNGLNNIQNKRENSRQCSNVPPVRLYNSSTLYATPADGNSTAVRSIKGLVQVQVSRYRFLCFPNSNEDYQQAYFLSHAVCRGQGFMTVTSMEPKELHYFIYGLKIRAYHCFPRDGSTSLCEWNEEVLEFCHTVTAISCGACSDVFKGFGGMIKTSGFPFASLTDVTCEWRVIVPEHHSILLSFNHFESLDDDISEAMCGVHKPFIEVMYGIQSEVTVKRYCQLGDVKNLSIPFNTVTIRIFTGLSHQRKDISQNSKKGIALTYEAIPSEDDPNSDPLKMILLTLLGLVFIACIVFCHYIEKHKLCNSASKSRKPVEVEKALEHLAPSNKETEKQSLGLSVRFTENEEKPEKGSSEKIAKNNFEKDLIRLHSLLEIPKEFLPVESNDTDAGHSNKLCVNWDMNLSKNDTESENPKRLAKPPLV